MLSTNRNVRFYSTWIVRFCGARSCLPTRGRCEAELRNGLIIKFKLFPLSIIVRQFSRAMKQS